jgi:hypothetical protein
MRHFKLKPEVISVHAGHELITDCTKEYPENKWPEEVADELVERGFLVEVKKEKKK